MIDEITNARDKNGQQVQVMARHFGDDIPFVVIDVLQGGKQLRFLTLKPEEAMVLRQALDDRRFSNPCFA